ncbi:MAG: alpha-L-fucosidase precursor [Lentisphaerae bacterium]|jgi:alpha-L-fucosidase|nr:alpha-L-fucosidase precursor [Lentisphaerota bacterium]
MKTTECPKYLLPYRELWERDHKKAILAWWREARFGLFLHYGLYSQLHRHEWVMMQDKIHVDEYAKLADMFTAHNFDAEYITDLALACGMKYVNLTTCHHESFCLWDSKIESFNAKNAPCGRDLVGELSEACDRKGLGFFAYYTFMLNWRHPYFLSRSDKFPNARPNYPDPEPRYLYKEKEDFGKYLDYIREIMDELLSNYKITGIWLDLISAWWALGEEYIPIEDIYAELRRNHPDVLISWKQGATGTEDFASPEHFFHGVTENVRRQFGDAGANRALRGFEGNRLKHNEICSSVQQGTWGYCPKFANRSIDELKALLDSANEQNCNLLLNAGPMADGSINPVHEKILLAVGRGM